jgi:hypothetical protein
MRPQDIERIARMVAGSFAGAAPATPRAGCGSLSSPLAYSCDLYACDNDYECGNAGNFTCEEGFACALGFYCAEDYTATLDR